MYTEILKILKAENKPYSAYEHEVITDYETAEAVGRRLGWTGTESKSLLLKDKSDKLYLYVTLCGERLDAKELKAATGQKLKLCAPEEVQARIGCTVGCVPPFGYTKEVVTVVDTRVYRQSNLLFSPGVHSVTLAVAGAALGPLIRASGGRVIELTVERR